MDYNKNNKENGDVTKWNENGKEIKKHKMMVMIHEKKGNNWMNDKKTLHNNPRNI